MDIKLEACGASEASSEAPSSPPMQNVRLINSEMKVEVCKAEVEDSYEEDVNGDIESTNGNSSSAEGNSSTILNYPDSMHIKEELDPVFICDVCGAMVESEEELKDHVLMEHFAMTSSERRVLARRKSVTGELRFCTREHFWMYFFFQLRI